jgi:DNA adenine methylase
MITAPHPTPPHPILPSRPVLRWHGGKWKLGPWIIAHFPRHKIYVEPFGGGGSVLMRKPRTYAEVYNDLDEEVVNLFSCLRDDVLAGRLIELLRLTPFARTEFNAAYLPSADPVERARRLVIRSYMGFGSDGTNSEWRTGFRANSNRSSTTPAHDWANYPACLAEAVKRLRGVIIENRDAKRVMASHDGADTLHYLDPPYLHATRSRKSRRRGEGGVAAYRHEMTDQDHAELLAFLPSLKGMVVLSGYPHPTYDDALAGWDRVQIEAHADGARDRTEVLWLNPSCAARLRCKGPLFEAVA